MNIKALIEKRNALVTKMQEIVDAAGKETRAFTDDENKQYADYKAEVEKLDETIKAYKETRDLDEKIPAEEDGEQKEQRNKEEAEELEARAFEDYIRGTLTEERAATSNFTFADNGAVIPTSIANKIIDKVVEISPIYNLATKYNVGGTLTIPYYDASTGDITMAYAEEFTELTSTSGSFKSISLKGFLAGVLTLVSKSLLNNSNFNLLNFVINKMAQNIAIWTENECINGTSGKIEGLSKITPAVTSAKATSVTADELIDLQESIPDMYQANAIWIMNKKTRTEIRKLKDSDGQYLLNKDVSARWGYTLLGKDVYISDNMPEMKGGNRAIIYGDLSGLAIKTSENATIDILREKYATQHAIGVYAYIEMDAKVENAEKIAVMKMSSTSSS